MFYSIKFAALAVLLGALSGSINAQATCDRTYSVNAGDTCDGISAAQGVSTYQLATVNKDVIDPLCDNLAVDEVICLALPGNDCSPVHIVASGDTCFDIATVAGTDVDTLLANNPNVAPDCSNIYPEEVLCTADTVVVVPP